VPTREKHPLDDGFAEAIKNRRVAAGLSQEALAHLVNLDRTYIGLLERGRRSPSLRTVALFAEAFEISTSRLVREAEKAIGI
jgi:transcriptional regulator with XRE-family HTH domain